MITEPLLANSGCCEPRPGYLEGLLEIAHAHGALVIFDEVITGFRLALGGAREYYGLTPDLSVYAKAVAGGFPLAAIAGSAAAFAPLLDGRTVHSGSNNGSPVAVAAALATLKVLSEPGTYDAMHAHGHAIRRHLEQEARRRGMTLVTSGAGSVFGVHFGLREPPRCYADTLAADAAAYARFRAALLDEGIYLLPDGRWYVGATHTERELQRTLPAITAALQLRSLNRAGKAARPVTPGCAARTQAWGCGWLALGGVSLPYGSSGSAKWSHGCLIPCRNRAPVSCPPGSRIPCRHDAERQGTSHCRTLPSMRRAADCSPS